MNISKSIFCLLLLVSSFFVKSEVVNCSSEFDYKLKPVFMNGMFNDEYEAIESADLMYNLVKKYVRDDPYQDDDFLSQKYYLAYNDSEALLNQLTSVSQQFLFDLINNNPLDKYTEEEKEKYLEEYEMAYTNLLDEDSISHQVRVNQLLSEGYKLLITSHSQGNIYFNMLYHGVLQHYPNMYRVLSLGSPVTVLGDPNSYKMLIEEDDFIRRFLALKNVKQEGLLNKEDFLAIPLFGGIYNIENSDKKGHYFDSYIKGDNTKSYITKLYDDFFEDLFPNHGTDPVDKLTIDVKVDSQNVELLFTEDKVYQLNNYLPDNITNYFASDEDGIFGNEPYNPSGRGYFYKDPNDGSTKFSYSVSCHNLSSRNNKGANFSLMVLNKSGNSVNLKTTYQGLFNEVASDIVTETGRSDSDYATIGYNLRFKKLDYGSFDITAERIYPNYNKPLIIKIETESTDFNIKIRGFYTKHEGEDLLAIHTCKSNTTYYCDPQPDEDGNYDVIHDYGKLTKTLAGYEYELDLSDIPEGYGPTIEFFVNHDKNQFDTVFDIHSDLRPLMSYEQSIGGKMNWSGDINKPLYRVGRLYDYYLDINYFKFSVDDYYYKDSK